MGVKINYNKVQDAMAAFDTVKENITPETLEKFKVKAALDYMKEKNQIKASGTGFDLSMKFLDNHAEVDLKLSLLLRPFQDKVLGALEKQLKAIL
jgi:hypothetical protein